MSRKTVQPSRVYRIGEAARALNLQTSVLRFWEGEFPMLRPVRTPKGQRLYSERDMALLRSIQSLLHERGMTIEGARRILANDNGKAEVNVMGVAKQTGALSADAAVNLREIVQELQKLRAMLAGQPVEEPHS